MADDKQSEREARGDDPRSTTEQDKVAGTGREQPTPGTGPGDSSAVTRETSATAPGIVPAASDKAPGKGAKYFKSFYSGQSESINKKDENGTMVTEIIARFFPYAETFQGDTVSRGYLATSDKRLFERFEADPNIEELTKAEYDKAVKAATPLGYPQA